MIQMDSTTLKNESEAIMSGLTRSYYEENRNFFPLIYPIFDQYSFLDTQKYEDISLIMIRRMKDAMGVFAMERSRFQFIDDRDIVVRNKILFIYTDYEFLKNQIVGVIGYGQPGTSEIARYLIAVYLQKLFGPVPEFPKERLQSYYPPFGTVNAWMTFIDECIHMYNRGVTLEYIDAYNRLKNQGYRS